MRTQNKYVCVRPESCRQLLSSISTKGLFSAPFADGCGLDESLAKVLRFVFLTVEDRFI